MFLVLDHRAATWKYRTQKVKGHVFGAFALLLPSALLQTGYSYFDSIPCIRLQTRLQVSWVWLFRSTCFFVCFFIHGIKKKIECKC